MIHIAESLLASTLSDYGDFESTGKEGEYRGACPWCARPYEKGTSGTLVSNVDKNGAFICYRCEKKGINAAYLLLKLNVPRELIRQFNFQNGYQQVKEVHEFKPVDFKLTGDYAKFSEYNNEHYSFQELEDFLETRKLNAEDMLPFFVSRSRLSLAFPVYVQGMPSGCVHRSLNPKGFDNGTKYFESKGMESKSMFITPTGESLYWQNTEGKGFPLFAEENFYRFTKQPASRKRILVIVEGLFDMIKLHKTIKDYSRKSRFLLSASYDVVMSGGRALSEKQCSLLQSMVGYHKIYLCWDGILKDTKTLSSYAKLLNKNSLHENYSFLRNVQCVVYGRGDPGDLGAFLLDGLEGLIPSVTLPSLAEVAINSNLKQTEVMEKESWLDSILS